MTNYVLAFRGNSEPTSPEQDAAWMSWFEHLGSSIVDWGNRVGRISTLGNVGVAGGSGGSVLTGYIVVSADDMESAVTMAKGCPGLSTGAGVEIAEVVPMS